MASKKILAAFIIMLFVLSIVASIASVAAKTDKVKLDQKLSDEFDKKKLENNWNFINPTPNPADQSYSLSTNPGFLTMTVDGPNDLIGTTDTAPRIMEDAPKDKYDFQIVVHLIANPVAEMTHAGILIYQDTGNFVRLLRDRNQNSVSMSQQIDFAYEDAYSPFSGSDLILRLTKIGTTYVGEYSTDGVNFLLVGTFTNALKPHLIGMTVVSTPAGTVFSADFDYFRVYTLD